VRGVLCNEHSIRRSHTACMSVWCVLDQTADVVDDASRVRRGKEYQVCHQSNALHHYNVMLHSVLRTQLEVPTAASCQG
jgi:hypothetical protein